VLLLLLLLLLLLFVLLLLASVVVVIVTTTTITVMISIITRVANLMIGIGAIIEVGERIIDIEMAAAIIVTRIVSSIRIVGTSKGRRHFKDAQLVQQNILVGVDIDTAHAGIG